MEDRSKGGFPRRSSRGKTLAALVVALLLMAVFTALPAFAVHDETFQLDGNIDDSDVTNLGGHPQAVDWESVLDSAGVAKSPLPTGFQKANLDRDFVTGGTASSPTFLTSDTTTFATGSKDTLPISGWQCNFDNNVNSKVDVMNAYAASYTNADKDQILYFALERNTNTGDANVAFWFLQDEVACETSGSSMTFSGEHRDGDLLIVSAFTKGGDVSNIDVYKWYRPDLSVPGYLGTTPVATGRDCRDETTPAGDDACATANTSDISEIPWLTSNFKDGVGHNLRVGEFFEGGINLTDAGLGGKCFNVFLGDTRSSQSLTATLFDYARGKLGECTSETVTTPSITTPTEIDADGSMSVTDSASVTVTGVPKFSGTVNFHLCGPFAASSTQRCTNDALDPDTVGVAAGSQTLTDATSPQTVSSSAMTITSAGRYCWRAEYSGDIARGVPGSSDSRESECFLITPKQSTLSTQAGAGPVDFGKAVTDTATLGNTANDKGSGGPSGSTDGSINPVTAGGKAGGTITFKLYGPDSCTTLAAGFPEAGISRDVSGDDTYPTATQDEVSFTPQAPGTYYWKASYSGDLPNTLASSHNGDCKDDNEKVVVRQIPTTIKTMQSWYPNDTATISATIGNLAAGGTVAFGLYDNATCQDPDGPTGLRYSETKTLEGGSPTEEVGTKNTSFNITTLYTDAADIEVTYSWKVVYTPAAADTAHTGKMSSCNTEHFSIKYTNDKGPGSDLPT